MRKPMLSALLLVSLTMAGAASAGDSIIKASPAPDNSAVNARDTQGGPPTPEDQSEKVGDRELTRKIRQAVVSEQGLSTAAKNIKIITINGVVTLRGPVDSAEERDQVVARALALAGNGNVSNLLEVKASR